MLIHKLQLGHGTVDGLLVVQLVCVTAILVAAAAPHVKPARVGELDDVELIKRIAGSICFVHCTVWGKS